MPLSLVKLEKLLALKGFIPTTFFVIDNMCVYIEVLSIVNPEIFLLYIPSKYKFVVEKGTPIPVYNIDYIELNEHNNIPDDYAGELEQNDIENIYEEIDLNMSLNLEKNNNISPYLEENYNRQIKIQDVQKDDVKEIKDILRQLKRLKLCVQNVRYKIAILYKNYLCTIKRDDSIECYVIKKYKTKKYKKLLVSVDLELLYEKMESLLLNMTTVRKSLYHILDKNQFTHTKTFQKLLEEKNDIANVSQSAYLKKQSYEKYIKEYEEMLDVINTSEKSTLEKIHEINQRYNDLSAKGLHDDIEKSHHISKHTKDLSEIEKIKQDIVKSIFQLKNKREDIMLNVDKIMFDNNVMIECVIRNFIELGKISK
jgi:hypothetical protein